MQKIGSLLLRYVALSIFRDVLLLLSGERFQYQRKV